MLSKALKRAAKLTGKWTPHGEFFVDVYAHKGSVVMDTGGHYFRKAGGMYRAHESFFYDIEGILFENILYLDEEGGTEKRNHGLIKEITLLFRDREGDRRRVVIQ